MFTFHHIAVSVSNIEKSKQFYGFFGLKSILNWESPEKDIAISHLAMDGILLELFCYKNFKKDEPNTLENDLKTIGVKHFALKVNSIAEASEQLIKAGLVDKTEITINIGRTGIKYMFVKSPDDLFIEIVEDNRIF